MDAGNDVILGEDGILKEIDERRVEVEIGVCNDVDVTYRYQREYCDGRMSLPLMIATVVLGFITIIVNLGVIIRTIKIIRQGHDKPAFFFIGNLALSDFAIGVFVVVAFLLHVTNKSDLWRQNTCMLQIGIAVMACQETIFTIVLISIDKYLYICHGLRYSSIMTRRRVYAALILSWCVALLIGSLPAMGLHVSWPEACNRCAFPQVISTTFAVIFFITSVAVPFAVVVALYCLLLTLALKMQKARYGGSYTGDEKARSSNFRLSFMSSKRSKNSSTRTTASKTSIKTTSTTSTTISTSISKANRRRIRRMEMWRYKEELARCDDAADGGGGGGGGIRAATPTTPADGKEMGGGVVEGRGEVIDVMGVSMESDGNDGLNGREETWCDETEDHDRNARTTSSNPHLKRRTETCETVIWDHEEEEGEEEDREGVNTPHLPIKDKTETNKKSIVKSSDNSDEMDEEDVECKNSSALPRDDVKLRSNKKRSKVWKDYSEEEEEEEGTGVEGNDQSSVGGGGARGSFFPSKYMNKIVAETRDKVMFLKKCRAIKTVMLILVSFAATYVPFVVGTLVYSAEKHKSRCLLHLLNTLLYCAVVANSLANPLIYAYGYREFRIRTERFKGVLAKKKPRPYT